MSAAYPVPSPARTARWSFAGGLAGGLAFWMHPLAVWYLTAAALLLLLRVRGRRWLPLLAGGLPGLLLGATPFWLYNLQTNWSTLQFVLRGSQGQTADHAAVFAAWWNNDLPRGAGLWHPWGSSPTWAAVVMAILLAAALTWSVLARRRWALQPLDALLLLLAAIPTIFVFSGFGGPALNPYGFDATGRYTPPIWCALAVVLAAAGAALWRRWRGLALAGLCIPLGINLLGITSIDPAAAFQSPYWDRLPLDSTALLDVLRDNGITGVWLNHWAGQPLMFDAAARGQDLVAYDWYDVRAGGIDRFPEYLPRVRSAAVPAFVLVTSEDQPELVQRLQQLGVTFRELRAPPYVVVVPRSRRVDPAEVTPALDYRY